MKTRIGAELPCLRRSNDDGMALRNAFIIELLPPSLSLTSLQRTADEKKKSFERWEIFGKKKQKERHTHTDNYLYSPQERRATNEE